MKLIVWVGIFLSAYGYAVSLTYKLELPDHEIKTYSLVDKQQILSIPNSKWVCSIMKEQGKPIDGHKFSGISAVCVATESAYGAGTLVLCSENGLPNASRLDLFESKKQYKVFLECGD